MIVRPGERVSPLPGEAGAWGFEADVLNDPNAEPTLRTVQLDRSPADGESVVVRDLPPSFVGAPVFVLDSLGSGQARLVVLGVVGTLVDESLAPTSARTLVDGREIRAAARMVFEELRGPE